MTAVHDPGNDPFAADRAAMVAGQIESRGIRDPRVLEVMRRVPRHLFVSEESRDQAHSDGPLPIGGGQTISQPYVVAYMTELLSVRPDARVLEIGTGSGYQTAVLAELADWVFTVERQQPLAGDARRRLDALGYRNIRFRTGDGWHGWPEEAPFDRIIVTAAPDRVPEALVRQLKEGGKIVVPVGVGTQEIIEGDKRHEILEETRKIAVRFVPLIHAS